MDMSSEAFGNSTVTPRPVLPSMVHESPEVVLYKKHFSGLPIISTISKSWDAAKDSPSFLKK